MEIAGYCCTTAHETFSFLPDCLASRFPSDLAELERVTAHVARSRSVEAAALHFLGGACRSALSVSVAERSEDARGLGGGVCARWRRLESRVRPEPARSRGSAPSDQLRCPLTSSFNAWLGCASPP